MVPLKDGTKLDCCTALQQLHGGMITMQDIVDEDDCSVLLLAVPSNTPSDNEDHHKQSVPHSTTSDVHLHRGLQSMSNDEDDCEQFVPPNIPLDVHLSHALQNMSSNEDDHEQCKFVSYEVIFPLKADPQNTPSACHLPCTLQKVSYTWKVLLDLLFIHKHTIVDWPAGVPAVGPDFNVKCLNANELCALTVPFLTEQMEQDYKLEAPAEEEEDHIVPVPASSFYLKHWTAEQLQLLHEADLKAFDIPLVVNTLHHSLCLISDSQAFVKVLPPTMHQKGPDQEAAPCLPLPPAKAQPHPPT
ncbi:hypothetical protein F5J12DRAFT_890060 [Pisolithus orientalis]|uniref:uncharacterized protein n=1 Tax=Pisolithus orientalis TaxID=936130 RepID=UPI002225685A|nr:uncharacterized protein F5J12DRAFT_890060 [Pisolithus orientalis]KAI6019756.1 hypothetical protein F5J12DRAFT_890060 [Pisolithus orientalis]